MKLSASYFWRAILKGLGEGLLGSLVGSLVFAFINSIVTFVLAWNGRGVIRVPLLLNDFRWSVINGVMLSTLPAAFGGVLLGIWLSIDLIRTTQAVKMILLKSITLGALLAVGISIVISSSFGALGYVSHLYFPWPLVNQFPGWGLNIYFSIVAVIAASMSSGWAGVRLARDLSKMLKLNGVNPF